MTPVCESDSTAWQIKQVQGMERLRVAAFVRSQFQRHFNAAVDDDTAELYGIYAADGKLAGAFGLSFEPRQFFSRHYVGDVREVLQPPFGMSMAQGSVVELSHLCVVKPATICRIVPVLAKFLSARADLLVCTVTSELARYFNRRGLASHQLGRASFDCLPCTERAGWGEYYAHEPVVLAGDLRLANATLNPTVAQPRTEVRQVA